MTRTGLAPALTLWKKECVKSFMIFSSECNTAFILCFLVCFRVIRRVSSYSQLLKEIRKIFNSFFSADLFSFYSSSQLKRASYTLLASELGYNKYNECSWLNTSYTQLIILVSRIQGQSDVTYFFSFLFVWQPHTVLAPTPGFWRRWRKILYSLFFLFSLQKRGVVGHCPVGWTDLFSFYSSSQLKRVGYISLTSELGYKYVQWM